MAIGNNTAVQANGFGGSSFRTTYTTPLVWHDPSVSLRAPSINLGGGGGSGGISNNSIKESMISKHKNIVGNGKSTSFTFAISGLPTFRVFERVVEGEGDEQTVTLKVSDAAVEIIEDDTLTVEFATAPARRGALVVIG